jgi:uncharacterized protein YkwD
MLNGIKVVSALWLCLTTGLLLLSAGCPATDSAETPPLRPDKQTGELRAADEVYSVFQVQLVVAHNDLRRIEGLPLLELSPLLTMAAQSQAEWMAVQGRLQRPGDKEKIFIERIRNTGYNMQEGGENTAGGFDTVNAVMVAWMKSEPHRQNILHKDFQQIGVGHAMDTNGCPYWCVVFGVASSLNSQPSQPDHLDLPPGLSAGTP